MKGIEAHIIFVHRQNAQTLVHLQGDRLINNADESGPRKLVGLQPGLDHMVLNKDGLSDDLRGTCLDCLCLRESLNRRKRAEIVRAGGGDARQPVQYGGHACVRPCRPDRYFAGTRAIAL